MFRQFSLAVSFVLGVCAALAWVQTARTFAQGPQPETLQLIGTGFTYQGQLKQNGAPVTAPCDMAFRLYGSDMGGPSIGSAITRTVPVTGGLFTAQLDFGVGAFDGDARYLDIQVRCPAGAGGGSFTPLTPRQPLTAAPYALALPGLRTEPNATSPNVVGGFAGNVVSPTFVGAAIGGGGSSSAQNRVLSDYGVVGGGSSNTSGYHAVVGGGMENTAAGSGTVVGGGFDNRATGDRATVAGGESNQASGSWAFIGGGSSNLAADDAVVGGGMMNVAAVRGTVIGGGFDNLATGFLATVAGGEENAATGSRAFIGGGALNTATGLKATVPGGEFNTAAGAYSFAAGRNAKANHDGTFVWADGGETDFSSGGANQFAVRATGGISLVTGVDISGTPTSGVTINAGGLDTAGTVVAGSLRVSTNGTTFDQVVAGTATIGPGSGGVKVYTVTLPFAFEATPNVIATPRSNPPSNTNDTFVVTVRKSAATYFVVNVYRVDVAGGSWSQGLLLDWMAWH